MYSALEVYYENALYKFTFYITLHYIDCNKYLQNVLFYVK